MDLAPLKKLRWGLLGIGRIYIRVSGNSRVNQRKSERLFNVKIHNKTPASLKGQPAMFDDKNAISVVAAPG
jgi:hypothetical protein